MPDAPIPGLTPEGFDVDFLPVGDGEKSGDAIAIRFWTGATSPVVYAKPTFEAVATGRPRRRPRH